MIQASGVVAVGQLLSTNDVVAIASAIDCGQLPGVMYQQFHKPVPISTGITAGLRD